MPASASAASFLEEYWKLVTFRGSRASNRSPAPPRILGTQADWKWPWPYGVKPFAPKRCRKTAHPPWSPDTLRSCRRGWRRRWRSPCCAGRNRQSTSSPGSTTWSYVRACSRSLLRSGPCFCSKCRWTRLWRRPTPPPSSSVRPCRLCTEPGPSCWSGTGGPGKAAAPSVWSPRVGCWRSSDMGWPCLGPGQCRWSLEQQQVDTVTHQVQMDGCQSVMSVHTLQEIGSRPWFQVVCGVRILSCIDS